MGDCGGGTDVVDVDVTFDDAAATGIPDAGPLTTGTFRPTYIGSSVSTFPAPAPAPPYSLMLSSLNGTIQNGTWSLYVIDDSLGDLGDIGMGWSITITAPTLAEMNAIAARSRADGQSVIKWTTGFESDNLGFNVYREGANGRVRLNKPVDSRLGLPFKRRHDGGPDLPLARPGASR